MHIVIIGSGIAGITFAEKMRSLSPDAKITLLSRENQGYYSRPMLSRGFSTPDIDRKIILKPFATLLEKNICVIGGISVTRIDRNSRRLYIQGAEDLETLSYDKLVLAPGSDAFIPPPLQPYRELFFILNSLVDLQRLRKFRQPFLDRQHAPRWAIIGGGLIGCEVASDLAFAGDKVTVFHAMDRLMERQLVAEDSAKLLEVLQDSSVQVLLNQFVQALRKNGGKIQVVTSDSGSDFDAVLVACGFKPRTQLAADAGLETGRGIKVDQFLQSSDENIYVLGDAAELPNGKLYAFILPIRHQANWLAARLSDQQTQPWQPPAFNPKAKVHGFEAAHPYLF